LYSLNCTPICPLVHFQKLSIPPQGVSGNCERDRGVSKSKITIEIESLDRHGGRERERWRGEGGVSKQKSFHGRGRGI